MIAGLTAFRYFSDQTQIIEARVSYKADGSVDKYREETRYEPVRQFSIGVSRVRAGRPPAGIDGEPR